MLFFCMEVTQKLVWVLPSRPASLHCIKLCMFSFRNQLLRSNPIGKSQRILNNSSYSPNNSPTLTLRLNQVKAENETTLHKSSESSRAEVWLYSVAFTVTIFTGCCGTQTSETTPPMTQTFPKKVLGQKSKRRLPTGKW